MFLQSLLPQEIVKQKEQKRISDTLPSVLNDATVESAYSTFIFVDLRSGIQNTRVFSFFCSIVRGTELPLYLETGDY
jgi:hypothetical protein